MSTTSPLEPPIRERRDPSDRAAVDVARKQTNRTWIVGTPQQFRWLHWIVKCVLVMNLFDAVLTLLWVRAGLAAEANPLIDELVNQHAMLFVLVKLSLVGMGSWLLWQRRETPLAVVGIFTAFIVYYGILTYHVQYASALLGHLFRS